MSKNKFSIRLRANQRGNALIQLAVILPILIGISGLVLDVSRGVWTKTKLQRAADAGALAGAGYIPNLDTAQLQAMGMVRNNYGEVDEETYTPFGNEYSVEVTKSIPTYFMRLFGRDEMVIRADATAITQTVAGGVNGGGFPFAIINPNLNNDPADDLVPGNYGRKYVIGYGEDNVSVPDWVNGSVTDYSVTDGNGRGWRDALGLKADGTLDSGAGASDIRYDITDGWPGKLRVGDLAPIKTGNMTSIDQARTDLLGGSPLPWANFDTHRDGDNPRVILVPIIHLINQNRRDTYTIADWQNGQVWDHEQVVIDGFAPFFLLTKNEQGDVSMDGKNNDRDWITGYYIPGVEIPNYLRPDENGTDFGLYAVPRLNH